MKFTVRNFRKFGYCSDTFHFTKNSGTIERKTNGTKKALEKFPENPKIADILKCEPFNRKFGQYREKINGTKIPGKNFPKLLVCLARLTSFPENPKIAEFLKCESFASENFRCLNRKFVLSSLFSIGLSFLRCSFIPYKLLL